mgnify:FL=1
MTNDGLFDEIKKDKRIARLKTKVKKLNLEIKTMKMLSNIHQKINGRLRVEIEKLKKDNELLQDGNSYLGIYNQNADPVLDLKALLERQTKQAKAMVQVAKIHSKNVLYKNATENWLKNTITLEKIFKKFTRKN